MTTQLDWRAGEKGSKEGQEVGLGRKNVPLPSAREARIAVKGVLQAQAPRMLAADKDAQFDCSVRNLRRTVLSGICAGIGLCAAAEAGSARRGKPKVEGAGARTGDPGPSSFHLRFHVSLYIFCVL